MYTGFRKRHQVFCYSINNKLLGKTECSLQILSFLRTSLSFSSTIITFSDSALLSRGLPHGRQVMPRVNDSQPGTPLAPALAAPLQVHNLERGDLGALIRAHCVEPKGSEILSGFSGKKVFCRL